MKNEMIRSLERVVEYLHEREQKDYEECPDGGYGKEHHIYNDVLALQNWLDERN